MAENRLKPIESHECETETTSLSGFASKYATTSSMSFSAFLAWKYLPVSAIGGL